MSNLKSFFSLVEKDKYILYIVGLLIAMFTFAICTACKLGVWASVPALTLSTLAVYLIERVRVRKEGKFDGRRFAAGFLGMFTAAILISILLIK